MAVHPNGSRAAIGAALLVGLAACTTRPYPVDSDVTPPWEPAAEAELPAADPPFSPRAHRISLCYGEGINDEQEVREVAAELCADGRLLVEHQNTFWNGCSVLQPVRVTYICDPPPPPPSENQ